MAFENEQRKNRILVIRNSILRTRRARKMIQYDMLISTIMTEFGVSHRTAVEYLRELIDGKFIKLEPSAVGTYEIFLSENNENNLEEEFKETIKEFQTKL